jgi:thiol-disulfide isomerase/thioredoxin
LNRRKLIYGAAGATALLAGGGFAVWRHGINVPPRSADGGVPESNSTADAFWRLSFDTPAGLPLAMSSFRGKPLLVNFWATWCPPCVEELPLLDYFYQENKSKNWQVLGLAVDQPSAVRTWLQAKPLNFPVGMAGLSGTDLSKSLGNLAGSLPFSVVFSESGAIVHRKIGKVEPEELARWALLK